MYEELCKEIEFYMNAYGNYPNIAPVEKLNIFMRKIKNLSYDIEFSNYFNQKYSRKERELFGEMLINIECIIEKNSVEDFLAGHTDIIDEKLDRCSPEMKIEGKFLNLTKNSHVLIVGSGSMPITAVVLIKYFNCKITCLDIDKHAIDLSKKWITHLALNNNVKFINYDIFDFVNYKPYTHIIITGHIFNKAKLLEHLSVYLKNDQKILLRNSSGLYREAYQAVSHFKNYEILDVINHNCKMPYASYIIRPIRQILDLTTPFYLFDLSEIRHNYNHICQLLSDCNKVFYALKANGDQTIINSMKKYAVPFEVSSIQEFHAVNSNPEYNEDIICSLPIKTEEMISELYKGGCKYFVFDCWEEYEKLARLAPDALKIIRVNIKDLSHDTIDYGMTENEFYERYNGNAFKIDGVTFYNIPNLSINHIILILERCQRILSSLSVREKILNIGGNYRFESELEPEFYTKLHKKLSSMKSMICGLKIYAEPGRTIVKSAGKIFAKVILIKKNSNKTEVFINAGIPSGILYPPRKVGLFNTYRVPTPCNIRYDFYAITCSKKLLFSIEMSYMLEENDIIVLEEMGTYSLCKSNHFHGWDLPEVKYLLEEDQKG